MIEYFVLYKVSFCSFSFFLIQRVSDDETAEDKELNARKKKEAEKVDDGKEIPKEASTEETSTTN